MHRLLLFTVLLLGCVICPSLVQAASFQERVSNMAEIKAVRINSGADKVRIVVDATREVDYDTVVLSNPQRIVVNINGAWLSPAVERNTAVDSSFANKVRISQFDKDTVRIVVESNVSKTDYDVFSLTGGASPYRVVLDFGGNAVTRPTTGPVVEKPAVKPDVPEVVLPEPVYDKPGLAGKTIVLDPGHGGSDSGAIGPTGVTEKSITLRVVSQLRQLLEQSGAKVLLTHSTDVDVAPQPATDAGELQARCDVANQAKADIFLSLHMDSFTNGSARGTTVYYYGKGTKAAQRLAENVRQGLLDQLGTDDRGTKSSNFYVVKHTAMPSILAEMAFVSNPAEEKMMNSAKGIEKAARGIFDGISRYFGD